MPIHGSKNSEDNARDITEDIRRVVQKRLDLANKHYEEIKKELYNDELSKLKGEEGLSEKENQLLLKTLLQHEKDMERLKIELKGIKKVDKEEKDEDEEEEVKNILKGEDESKQEGIKEEKKEEEAMETEEKEKNKKSDESVEPLTKQILTGLKILEDMLNEDENKVLEEKGVETSMLMEEESTSEREQFMLEQDKLLIEQERKTREEIEKLMEEDDDYLYTSNNQASLVERMNMLYGYPREGTSKKEKKEKKEEGSKGEIWKGFKERWKREEAANNLRGDEKSSIMLEQKEKKQDKKEKKKKDDGNRKEVCKKEQDETRDLNYKKEYKNRREESEARKEMSTPELEISDLSSDESTKNHFSYIPEEGRSNYNSDLDNDGNLVIDESEETEHSSEENYWTSEYDIRTAKKARVDDGKKEKEKGKKDGNKKVTKVEEKKDDNEMGKNAGLFIEKDKVKVEGKETCKAEAALKVDIMQMQETMKALVELGKERLKLITEKNNVELHIEWIKVGLNRGAFGESLQNYFVRTIKEMEEGMKMMEERIKEIEVDEGRLRREMKIMYPYGDYMIVDGDQQTVAQVVEVEEVIVIE
ncbi:hypothetical protein TOT_030000829 [Theileria orientalis strain Shintoku]|uniref:Uncharacterized protein n=1 Tax=Theileria orientalis strain Shintoku TaxID=869250 RepID=J4C449_THEOR|nr:hypothetical protein TOT_030000829 [Theileria orientalis strain Shintoku]BAM41566.1 hypothetical protein TOT_030000829 [Theileria orientalis strain Shintoku]|eukprot:XP_009691867.1 hypothetical protein TOT_030000829 [Theileria orientalis strain Shintoku]